MRIPTKLRCDPSDVRVWAGALLIAAGFLLAMGLGATCFWLGFWLMVDGIVGAKSGNRS